MNSAIHPAALHAGANRFLVAGLPRLLARSRSPRPVVSASMSAPRATRPVQSEARALLADVRRGPGWFESSWDLQQGLEVREGLPTDARLHEWIGVCLRER